MNDSVFFTPEAKDDLFDLYDYIADRSTPKRALGYINRIEKSCLSLQVFAERGTSRDDLRPGLRVMGFERRVLIAFRVDADSVALLRILYGGRSVELAFPKKFIETNGRSLLLGIHVVQEPRPQFQVRAVEVPGQRWIIRAGQRAPGGAVQGHVAVAALQHHASLHDPPAG